MIKVYKIAIVLFLLLITSCNSNQKDTSNEAQINREQKMKTIKDHGVITKVSAQDFEKTYTTLVNVITSNPNLKIITELDHQANAASVGLELKPTRVIMFGNPNLGTPLMQNAQITGLDLPQKILVWEDHQGEVKVSYNDPFYLEERHGIKEKNEVLQKINGALGALSDKAIGNF